MPRTLAALFFLLSGSVAAQESVMPPLAADRDDPVFTTYAAPMERSEYLIDEGYHLRFHEPGSPLALTSDSAGEWGVLFELDGMRARAVGDYARAPTIRQSFASLSRLDFEPFVDLHVDATFSVYSSRQALLALRFTNRSASPRTLRVYAFATAPESGFERASLTKDGDGLVFGHREPPESLSESPPPDFDGRLRDLLLLDGRAASFGGYPAGMPALLHELDRGLVSGDLSDRPKALLLSRRLTVDPGESASFRVVRAVAPRTEKTDPMLRHARDLVETSPDELLREEASRLARAPRLSLDADDELVYRGALAIARQSMLPPEGRTRFNYYVFSREPTWSWGHDGQVFHESLSMLAYAHLDPESAMDSQRVFIEAQEPDGYIPYRIGPYVVRTFPVEGERTTSAPFFSWTSWEVYRVAAERVSPSEARRFLEEAYESGAAFTDFLLRERDVDGDGLLEWGGHAVLESVRDSLVPIWDLLGENDPRAPGLVEALDLSTMVVREMRALALMAEELDETDRWTSRADELARLVEETMWDDESGFYYNVDRDTNRFVTPDGLDLRRMEIIGFLPLWAGTASPERAKLLVERLTDPGKFWRRFGIPTLAADDPGYQAEVVRCCQWNGAVWLEWEYLVFDGLRRYGYDAVARELAERMLDSAKTQLARNHRFWESYSPDEVQLRSPASYIWNAILARVLIDLEESRP